MWILSITSQEEDAAKVLFGRRPHKMERIDNGWKYEWRFPNRLMALSASELLANMPGIQVNGVQTNLRSLSA